jgi:hypothetical protein
MFPPVSLFWLCYRRGDWLAGAVVIEAASLVQARAKAAVAGLDCGFECEGFELDAASRAQIPDHMIGQLLGMAELAKLQRIVTGKKAAGRVRAPIGSPPDGQGLEQPVSDAHQLSLPMLGQT